MHCMKLWLPRAMSLTAQRRKHPFFAGTLDRCGVWGAGTGGPVHDASAHPRVPGAVLP